VFQLKEAVGTDLIREREESFTHRAMHRWEENPNIEILGSHNLPRLSIVSFVVRHSGRYLHHNVVVAVLNDLFGIQSRGGCSCAGPYGHRLLGIDLDTSHEFEREIARGCEGIKPGWVRVNFNYFISETVFGFVLDAVDLVAAQGWRLLPWYRFDPANAMWRHVDGPGEPSYGLSDVRYEGGVMSFPHRRQTEPESRLIGYLEEARTILACLSTPPAAEPLAGPVGPDFETLRWFWLPNEVAAKGAAPAG